MEIEGLAFGLFCIGAGLALMGYYIGKGLQHVHKPEQLDYYTLMRENEVRMFLNLNPEELRALAESHPDFPKVIVNGKTYYPKNQVMEWITTKDFTKN